MYGFRSAVALPATVLIIGVTALLLAQCQTRQSQSPNTDEPQLAGHKGVSLPVCTKMPSPPYTDEARAAKFEGVILAAGVVDLDGKVTNVRILRPAGLGLDESVIKTLKKWKCKPAKGPDGKPVPTRVPFQFGFHLAQTPGYHGDATGL